MSEVVLDIARDCSRVTVARQQTAAFGVDLGADRSALHSSAVESSPIRSTGGPDWANSSTARGGDGDDCEGI